MRGLRSLPPNLERARRPVDAALAAGATVAVLCCLLVAAVHLGDGFHVDHVAGAWMALSWYALDGTLYPPLHEDGYFGGTRYMPLGIALNTLGALLSGEFLVSGKAIAGLVVVGILVLVYRFARLAGWGRAVAIGAVGAVITNFTVLFAGTSIYGDALPVLLQLGALAAFLTRTRRGDVGAGVLAGLAFAAKLTAVWAFAAIGLWLLVRERSRLARFLVPAVATPLVLVVLAEALSAGRLHENLLGLAGSGFLGLESLVRETPEKLRTIMAARAPATLVLVPFVAVAVVWRALRREADVVDAALVLATAVTLVVLTDTGTDFNHVIDLSVLVPVVLVRAGSRFRDTGGPLVVGVLLGIATAVGLFALRSDVREAGSMLINAETPERLVAPPFHAELPRPYFTEDPSIAVERDERPVALDSFALLRILRDHPSWRRDLVARFERREFRAVVLIHDLDPSDRWWTESHLGAEVARAIDENYRLVRRLPGPVFRYRLLEPRAVAGARRR